MAIMVNNQDGDSVSWSQALQTALPSMPVYTYPDVPNPDDIQYAVVWHHPHEDLLRYENLTAVLILGAGTDHIDQAPELPKVPFVRLVDPAVGNDMAQYVLYWVMHFQRGYQRYRTQQTQAVWQRYEYPLVAEYPVTILGAGLIASFIAKRMVMNGFKVNVWSRRERLQVDNGVCFYHGPDGLSDALGQTRVLVNCLPLKPETHRLINADVFGQLPEGAFFINVSRGGVVDEQSIIDALESGQLRTVALDCTSVEPLPETHPFWAHPDVHLTPHMSGATFIRTAAQVLIDNITRMEQGIDPFPIYIPPQHQNSSD